MRLRRIIGRTSATILTVIILAYLILVLVTRPSNTRDWQEDQSRTAVPTIAGSILTVKDLRDFRYRGSGDILPRWTDETYDLMTLKDVAYISSPFKDTPAAAHTFLSFRFEDGRALAVSMEARRERTETYSIWKGALRQYETLYMWGTEEDLLGLRAIERGVHVELYPLTLRPDQGRWLLTMLSQQTNDVLNQPAFYNTLTYNCTTVSLSALAETAHVSLSYFDPRTLLSSGSPEMLQEAKLISSNATIDDLRKSADITDAVKRNAEKSRFSDLIREGLQDSR